MKKLLAMFTVLLMTLVLPAQQAKRVYITLDVSGSMSGDKYSLANYTTQMIVALCDDEDEVSLFLEGCEGRLSDMKSPLNFIQKKMGLLNFNSVSNNPGVQFGTQFGDIQGFNAVYKPSKNQQDWLFIIGDGVWFTESPAFEQDKNKFKSTVESGLLNVCYLQTGDKMDEDNDFTQFARTMGVIDIAKSSTQTKTILDGCDHFAKKILGFSEVSLDIRKDDANSIKLEAELPIKSFILLYQDEVAPEGLPKIVSAKAGEKSLDVEHKGTPTTTPVKNLPQARNLSGNVWKLKGRKVIPANTEILVEFDRKVDTKKVNIYPVVEEIEFGSIGLTPQGGGLVKVDDKTFGICLDEKTALVRIELNEECKTNLPENLLKKTNVVVKANNKDYKAKYKDGGFECIIDLKDERTQYYAECDCPGYFKRVTPIMTIVKDKEHCQPVEPPAPAVNRRETAEFGNISFDRLMNQPITGTLYDAETLETLDPSKFDLTVKVERGYLYDEPKVSLQGNTIVLDVHPKGAFCECLFPKDLNIEVISTPKQGAFQEGDRKYVQNVHPIHLTVDKSRPWAVRCFWVLMTLVGLLLLMFYLRGLLKKNRFHKQARLKNSYYVEDNPKEVQKNGKPLRRPGFGPWLDRWLNPFTDERMSTSFVRPKTGSMTFIASESKNRILMTESSFDAKKMTVPNYTPQPKDKKNKEGEPISISAGTSIEIKKTQGGETTRLGHLKYVVEGKDDEGGYRAVVGLLFGLSLIAFLALLWQMVRGLF